ncbi:diacylglycerol/lipid kinase family protein [Ramlibacter sp. Leaf400]|uniref:diacylglycerol/lipid kinase family protein n=1 Tax=Ramlibacter sp. Leaf400 TaxID=1736365 RepID=UPI0007015D9F|nr:diacylglycerol kinase family protein [Ramlibacter sp. Leaf400]KQT07630.1 diacylglycerol kinase [Ramlibacter sp. Leaf400]
MLAEVTDATVSPDASSAGPELFVLINPGSGDTDAQERRAVIARVFGEAGRRFRFVELEGPWDLAKASEAACSLAHPDGGIVVAVGGDGTLNTVAQAAWKRGCVLGVLPQGTFNLFGREWGIAQDLETAARVLLDAQPQPVQVGQINDRIFLVNASLGLYPQLLQDREAFKKQLGRHRWVAALAGLTTILQWRSQLALEIEMDGQRTLLKTPTLFVGNNRLQLERVGMEPHVASRVGEGCLAALIVKPISTWTMVWLMLRGAFGRLGDADEVRSFAFRTVTVRALRRRRMKVAADGEVGVMTPPLMFKVADRPLLLMVPRPEDRAPVE